MSNLTAKEIFVGILFCILAFIGTIGGNYLWWWQENISGRLGIHTTGVFSFLIFFILLSWLFRLATKMNKEEKEN